MPVLAKEVKELANQLANNPQTFFIDATLGYGGHSSILYSTIQNSTGSGTLLSIEWDPSAIEYVTQKFKSQITETFRFTPQTGLHQVQTLKSAHSPNIKWLIVEANFAYIEPIVKQLNKLNKTPEQADLILADLGASTPQLKSTNRGFSFSNPNQVLDMRMAPQIYDVKAADLLNFLSIKELERLFISTVNMPKVLAKKLAWAIQIEKQNKPFGNPDDVKRLLNICNKLTPLRESSKKRLHPATLVFLALRIAVNMELQNLYELLKSAPTILKKGGVLAVIGFHSMEWQILDKPPKALKLLEVIVPKTEEVKQNPKSRSAKMYIYQRI